MASAIFSSHTLLNLALPFEDLERNFRWANFARNAAYQRFNFCLSQGHKHKWHDRYHRRSVMLTPQDNEPSTWKYIRQLVEEADDFDRFRNKIEDTVIKEMKMTKDEADGFKTHFRSFNRRPEQDKIANEITENNLTFMQSYDPTAQYSNRWARDFADIDKSRTAQSDQNDIDSLINNGATQHQNDDPNKDSVVENHQYKVVRKRKPSRAAAAEEILIDPVIEQWYADPYNRHNPDGPAGTKLRKQNLTTTLRNRGFRGPRIINIVNWLIRCKGTYKDYDELVGIHRRKPESQSQRQETIGKCMPNTPDIKAANKRPRLTSTTPAKVNNNGRATEDVFFKELDLNSPKPRKAKYPTPTSVDNSTEVLENAVNNSAFDLRAQTSSSRTSSTHENSDLCNEATIDTDDNNNDNEIYDQIELPLTSQETAALQVINTTIAHARPSFHSTHSPGTQAYQDDHDDWLLETLTRTQEFWNIIYGDDFDRAADRKSQSKNRSESGRRSEKTSKTDIEVEVSKYKLMDRTTKGANDHNNNYNENNVEDEDEDKDEYADDDEVSDEVKFTYFRDEDGMPTPDVKYRTQGLRPVKRAMLKGQEVLTEDETFGLYVPDKEEKLEGWSL